MKCMIHKWNGCTCRKCGKKRDEGHTYVWVPDTRWHERYCYEKCSICGEIRTQKMEHDFSQSAGQCYPICSRCGSRTVLPQHQYQKVEGQCLRRCRVCGAEEKLPHKMQGRRAPDGSCEQYCTVCGKTVPGHVWHNGYNGCVCDVCGAANPHGTHHWQFVVEGDFAGIQVCKVCGLRDESEKCTVEAFENRRQMEAAMERADSLHEMRTKGIRR